MCFICIVVFLLGITAFFFFFFFSSRRRHTRSLRDWSSDVCSSDLLACPACARLVHADALGRLSAEARKQEEQGDLTAALASWQQALALLPAGTRQSAAVASTVARLDRKSV